MFMLTTAVSYVSPESAFALMYISYVSEDWNVLAGTVTVDPVKLMLVYDPALVFL